MADSSGSPKKKGTRKSQRPEPLGEEGQSTPGTPSPAKSGTSTPSKAGTPVPQASPTNSPAEQKSEDPKDVPKKERAPPSPTKSVETKKKESQSVEFTSIDPKAYGIEFEEEEFVFDPPANDQALPDLYRLLDTLEGGDNELETERQPPALFTRPEHLPRFQKISELKQEIEDAELGPHLEQFEEGVKDDVVMLGQISLEDVQEEEKHLRDEHIRYMDQEAERKRKQKEELLRREEMAKKRVAEETKLKREEIMRRLEMLRQKEKLLMDRLHRAYRRAESQLVSVLERRKGEIKTFYGDLMTIDGQYGGSQGRRWKVDWDKTPQPIQVKLGCLRGIRDKLPGGRYVLMVSLYNRLGGHVLRWAKLKSQMWGAASLPVQHDGYFYNTEMKFDQSVFTVLPSKASLKPGMVLVFELFLLRGATVKSDRVVGWGSFPICDAQFDIIEGKYKCPFLRGEMDPNIEKHETVEELVAGDLDHWLCNMYLEIVKLPRFLAGQKEYEVELEFSSTLTAYPDRVKTGGEECRDGENPEPGSSSTVGSEQEPDIGTSRDSLKSPSFYETDNDGGRSVRSTATTTKVNLNEANMLETTTYGSRIIHKDRKMHMAIGDDSEESDSDIDDMYAIKKGQEFKQVKGMPGMFYKHYINNPQDEYNKKLFSMLPKTNLLAPPKSRKKLTRVEQLEQHSIAVQPAFAGKGSTARKSYEKLQYVGRQFLSELGLSQWRSREFWGMIIMFIVIFFMRMYMHYIGQWLYLHVINIPVNSFNFLPYTVELNYQPTLLATREEIGVVWSGPLLNLVIFCLFIILVWISQLLFGLFPDLGCKFVIVYGLHTFLDPLTILIVDASLGRQEVTAINPIADFTKLYWHFDTVEGSGLAGIFLTAFIYVFHMFMTASCLYMYFLRLHNNGRLLDVYWRLRGDEDKFFIPYDLEVSNQELNYIAKKAEMWRGEEGERRKVAVFDYIWEEEDVEDSIWDEKGIENREKQDGRKEITTHLSIHTVHLDGLRELYRHFLRLPDGAIVEVFGDISIPGMDKDIKNALVKGSKGLEKLMGSQDSLNKVKGRQTVHTRSGFHADSPTPSSAGSSMEDIKRKKHM
ncbi:uncharacterized protein LOC110451314 [Mizuhopecten yessoensis]|uniref:Uncharacterized protein n=1 Tax=Mizuhopecten yessoensis TaxID=6573 RepID=A0A210QM15_MIZYE|nr:uncharacterized protein LOC110451314 [Mizuhopecten yessoensis]OWF49741.1 hypothetical protein KP79_PYT23864 [Mizuhopecten yessoensis]